MMSMPVLSVSATGSKVANVSKINAEQAARQSSILSTQNTKIDATKNSASAGAQAMALANQTGGNILGFTYE